MTRHDTARCDDPTANPATDPTDVPNRPPGAVAVAWPTGRPIYPYTADELADGVDLYTRAMRAAARDRTRRQP